MVAQVFSNLAAIYERYNNAMCPKVEEPTPEEKEQPLGKLAVPSADDYQFEISDKPIFAYFILYVLSGFYGAYVCMAQAKLLTIAYTLLMVIPSMLGLTAGAHRLWSHRSYKAKRPLELLLMFFYLLANQRSLVTWARHHRLHHQCSDTDGDPYNASRGFIFSHIGWMVVNPHPEMEKRLKHIDVSDLTNNPIIRFQEKYVSPLMALVSVVIPTYIPTLWGESLYVSFMSNLFRLNMALHLMSSVNSVAHLFGYKPVDVSATGTQFRLVGLVSMGEGFHNYHHAFPTDFRSSEFGDTKFNLAAMFIEFMAKIGWAYDLKMTSEEVVKNRVLKKGDGSDEHYLPDELRTKKQKFCCLNYYDGP